jgi:hypothetical protein
LIFRADSGLQVLRCIGKNSQREWGQLARASGSGQSRPISQGGHYGVLQALSSDSAFRGL